MPVCLWKFLAILEVSGRQPGYILQIQFPAVISVPGTIQALNTVWKDKSIACWLSGMICSCWRPSSLHGIRKGEDQRHSPTWVWSSHTLCNQKHMTLGSSLFFVSSSPTAISCHLTRASVHDHVALFFQHSIYSVVNTEWHLPLTGGIWFWLCHFGQDPSFLEGPIYISVSGVIWRHDRHHLFQISTLASLPGVLGDLGSMAHHYSHMWGWTVLPS